MPNAGVNKTKPEYGRSRREARETATAAMVQRSIQIAKPTKIGNINASEPGEFVDLLADPRSFRVQLL